jgi:hypothetical protein
MFHAGVCVPARDRARLEHLLRYAARPPLSNERLSLLPDGRLLYGLKRRWSDGTTHGIYAPMELMERLAALAPPPRFNVTRYFGVLAPASVRCPQDRGGNPVVDSGISSMIFCQDADLFYYFTGGG